MMELTGNNIMFVIFAAIIVIFSILTVTSRRILRAATYLLFVLIATSGIYFMLNYQFLAAIQLTLYAGGIVVLIIFSILLTSHISEKFEPIGPAKAIFSALAAICGAILCILTILQFPFRSHYIEKMVDVDMTRIGHELLNTNAAGEYVDKGFVLPFEVISILLLAAMIGSIVIAKKKSKVEDNK